MKPVLHINTNNIGAVAIIRRVMGMTLSAWMLRELTGRF
jgi:hypothetical protein